MELLDIKDSFKSVDTSSLVDKVEANLVALLQERKLKVGIRSQRSWNWRNRWGLAGR